MNIRKPYKFRTVVSECLLWVTLYFDLSEDTMKTFHISIPSSPQKYRTGYPTKDFIDDCTEFTEFFYHDSIESLIYYNTVRDSQQCSLNIKTSE